MTSLRVSLATASLLLLSASTLSAQAARIACKDGSPPKVGHFTCWGHGGVVTAPVKKAKAVEKKTAAKKSVVKKPTTTSAKRKAAKPAARSATKHATR
jgi:septal ring-binding cell division protein DamX